MSNEGYGVRIVEQDHQVNGKSYTIQFSHKRTFTHTVYWEDEVDDCDIPVSRWDKADTLKWFEQYTKGSSYKVIKEVEVSK